MTGINLNNVLLGRRGSGKSWFALNELIPQYRGYKPYMKVLIIDNIDHPAYTHIPRIHINQFGSWKRPSIYRCFGPDTDAIFKACTSIKDTLVIAEDATKFLGKELTKEQDENILNSKQFNIDLLWMFHSWMDVPPMMFRRADKMILFKTDDSPDIRKRELGGKYLLVKPTWDQVMADPNPYAKKSVNVR